MEQLTFSFYPITAGYKGTTGTSRDAAIGVSASGRRACTMAAICSSLADDGPATADELAARLDLDRLYVRPRVSELHVIRKVYDTGLRRPNASGRAATVWGVCHRIGDTPDQPCRKPRPRPELRAVEDERAGGPLARIRSILTSVLGRWRR